MQTNKELYDLVIKNLNSIDRYTEYIDNYKQEMQAREANEVYRRKAKEYTELLLENTVGVLELKLKDRYSFKGDVSDTRMDFSVIGKKCKDDILLFADGYNLYTVEDLQKEGWQTQRTEDNRIIWKSYRGLSI